MNTPNNKKITNAIESIENGDMVILVDDRSRENEGDLIFPAEVITPEIINFMIKNGSGIVCVSIDEARAKKLDLPFMIHSSSNDSQYKTPFTVSVEAKKGVTTGVSANDRAKTIQVMMNENSTPDDLAKPGHLFPLIANKNGVLGRNGHTEGALDLVKLSGFSSGAVLCELMNSDGTMMKGKQLDVFSKQHNLCKLSIQDIIDYRLQTECWIEKTAESSIVLEKYGEFKISIFQDKIKNEECVVLHKNLKENDPLVRVHSACFTGDLLGSLHCDCKDQLHYSLDKIGQQGGMVIYLNQEGRGIGLSNKIKAYALQREGLDTIEANLALGLPVDDRDYMLAIQVLKYFDLKKIKLLTNNPKKIKSIEKFDIQVEVEKIPVSINTHNQNYLQSKREKLNHQLESLS